MHAKAVNFKGLAKTGQSNCVGVHWPSVYISIGFTNSGDKANNGLLFTIAQ